LAALYERNLPKKKRRRTPGKKKENIFLPIVTSKV
jgi:hypothetical protein